MTPLERYQISLQTEGFVEDAAQAIAIAKLQNLFDKLVAAEVQQARQ